MLSAYLNQEVFMLVPSGVITEEDILNAFYTIEELNNYLEVYSEEELEDMRVLHGYLVPATIIPKDFNGVFPYIIVENPLDPGSGFVQESDADIAEELAEQMEKIIREAEKQDVDAEYSIKDFFILYGYELNLQTDPANYNRLCIAEFDINDIQINDAKEIVRQVNAVKNKYKSILD
jgi:hypothetical protein